VTPARQPYGKSHTKQSTLLSGRVFISSRQSPWRIVAIYGKEQIRIV
jgi:hypothetical protein